MSKRNGINLAEERFLEKLERLASNNKEEQKINQKLGLGAWEKEIMKILKRPINYRELNEACGWTGLEAKKWVESLWRDNVSAPEAARLIRQRLS